MIEQWRVGMRKDGTKRGSRSGAQAVDATSALVGCECEAMRKDWLRSELRLVAEV